MRISLSVLEAADTVVALKGWTHSQGAQIEWVEKGGRVFLYPLPVHGVLYRSKLRPSPVNVRGEPDQTGEAVKAF